MLQGIFSSYNIHYLVSGALLTTTQGFPGRSGTTASVAHHKKVRRWFRADLVSTTNINRQILRINLNDLFLQIFVLNPLLVRKTRLETQVCLVDLWSNKWL